MNARLYPRELNRRANTRESFDNKWLDLHYGLERRHDELDHRVVLLETSVGQLAEAQSNNHNESMSVLNRIVLWCTNHEKQDQKTANIQMLGVFILIVLLAYLIIR